MAFIIKLEIDEVCSVKYIIMYKLLSYTTLISLCLISASISFSQNITAIEYFINQDPGSGNGFQVSVQAADTSDVHININTTTLKGGLHTLSVRSLDDSNRVSLTHTSYWVKTNNVPANVEYVEYFIDNDPGLGSANPVLVNSADTSGFSFLVNTETIEVGLHHLYVRAIDQNGLSSITDIIYFVKINNYADSLIYSEYYIDLDPGFGQAIPISILSNQANILTIPTDYLLPGLHHLRIRSLSMTGNWTQLGYIPFIKVEELCPGFRRGEYFINADPGIGNAIPFNLSGIGDQSVLLSPDISNLPLGAHTIFIRALDSCFHWSQTTVINFFKVIITSELTELEYFIDDDPGYGAGTVLVLNGEDSSEIVIQADVSGLTNGLHTFSIRSKSSIGTYSLLQSYPFVKYEDNSTSIIALEYFIDIDPGYGQANRVLLPNQVDIDSFNFTVDISNLSFDNHKLHVRTYAADGRWSMTSNVDFAIYCQDSILLIDVVIPDSTYRAASFIRSNGTIMPANTIFKSNEIELLPGFTVPLGVQFFASNESCLANPNGLMTSSHSQSSIEKTRNGNQSRMLSKSQLE